VTFDTPAAAQTHASFSVIGTYVLRLTASDGQLVGTDTATVVVNDGTTGGYPFEGRVSTSTDDAEAQNTGTMVLDSGDLEMTWDGQTQMVGMRFPGIPITQGAGIVKAYIQFKVDETNSEATDLIFQAQAIDNAPTFTSTARNMSSRIRT